MSSFCVFPSFLVISCSIVGESSPYCFKSLALSSTSRSAFTVSADVARELAASCSAPYGFGAVISHFPPFPRWTTVSSPAFFLISSFWISESVSARILGGASVGVLVASLAFSLFDQYSVPANAARTSAAISNRIPCIAAALPPLPPRENAGNHDDQRKSELTHKADPGHLRS